MTDKPAGALVTPIATVFELKFAVTVAGAFIVRFWGVVVPLNAPLNPVNWFPEIAVALTGTTAAALNHPLTGPIDPSLDGFAAVVRKYCVVKFAVYVVADAGATIECDCAPPSDQLKYTYCVPTPPACGDVATAIV